MLRVWLPLDGNLENQGVSAVTATTFETPTYVAGKIGQCYQRANSNSQLTNGINLNSNLMDILGIQASIAVWVKPLGTHTHYNGTIASSGNWNAKKWAFGVSQDNSKVDVLCGQYNTYITCAVPVNEWTHLVSTFDNGTCKLYKNGEYVGQLTGQKAFETDATNACIARETYASGYFGFNGCVNDVRIYDHCLSAAEVHEISQGLVLHYKLDSLPYNFSTNTITSFTNFTIGQYYYTIFSINMTDFLSRTGAINGDKFTFSIDINAASNTKNLAARVQHFNSSSDRNSVIGNYITPGSSGRSSITFTINTAYTRLDFMINNGNSSNVTANSTEQYKCTRVEKGDIHTGYIQAGITPYIQDSSGYGHNGTILGSPIISSDTARYNSSIGFPANTDGILSTYPIALWNNAFTYSFWIKPNGENGGRSVYAASYSGTSCSIEKTTGNKLRFYWNGSPDLKTINLTITDGSWQHIAIVKSEDKTKVYCYYNGVLKDTFTDTISDKNFTGTLRIARDTREEATSYTGLMSDFRIYCTALSAADIKQLYEVGAKVDNKQNIHTYEFKDEGIKSQILKTGIVCSQEICEARTIPISSTSYSYTPAANTNNSTTSGITVDFSEFANCGKSITLTLEYDVSWSNLAAGTGGTFGTYLQGNNRKISGNTWAWEGTNYLSGYTFTSLVNANATGTVHQSKTFTIPATWFDTYNGSHLGGRTNYSNGNGTITVSNIKLTLSTTAKIKDKSIYANNLIEL